MLLSRGVETNYDYATVKYSPFGDTLWVRRYEGPAPSTPTDRAFGITVDESDNVYVTGWSDGVNDRSQCFTIKYSADGDSLWSHRYPSGGTSGYSGYDIIYDGEFIYVVARSNGYNDTLLKYDLDGNLIWSRAYITNHTFATNHPRLVLDKFGNIYMTSSRDIDFGSAYVALKYNPDGDRIWEYRYQTSSISFSYVYAICVDSNQNVYLTGEAGGAGTSYDIVTLKLSQDTTTNIQGTDLIPSEFQLLPAYPNPFNPVANITFSLPKGESVEIKIYNLLGEEITILISDYFLPGTHTIQWDVEDLPSGVYLCKMQAGGNQETIKLLLLK